MIKDKDAIHLIIGDSAAMSISKAFDLTAEQIAIYRDIPTLGRQWANVEYDEWSKLRTEELRRLFGDELVDYYATRSNQSVLSCDGFLTNDKPIIIWTDRTYSGQMFLAFICGVLLRTDAQIARAHIVQFADAEESEASTSSALGRKTEEELRLKRPVTTILKKERAQQLAEVCSLYCSADIRDHKTLIQSNDFSQATFKAMECLLRRYPCKTSGLDAWQKALLERANTNDQKAASIVGAAMTDNSSPDNVGDLHLFNELLAMGDSSLKHPLFEFTFDGGDSMRECTVKPLPLAEEVLEGRVDYIELNGIDRWIGGVHLTPDNLIYREDLLA